MRRSVLFVLAALLALSVARAESVDLSSLSIPELETLKARIVSELESRNPVDTTVFHFRDGGPWLLANEGGVKIFLTGRRRLDYPYYHLETAFENESGMALSVRTENSKLNGWNLSNGIICSLINTGEKKAGDWFYDINSALISSFEEMKELEFTVKTTTADYQPVHEYGPFCLLFNEVD